MSRYAQQTSTRQTPQDQQASPAQVKNSAGGWSFAVDHWKRLERFLILGAEGGTYYIGERKLITENTASLDECASEDGDRTVNMIVQVSEAGRAPKQDPAIFALARLSGHSNLAVRKAALAALPRVCRTGSHLFAYLRDIEKFRGWGRSLREAVGAWYTEKSARDLVYQVVKYQQREGESHRDALRRAHPHTTNADLNEVLAYAVRKLTVPRDWIESGPDHRRTLAAVEAAKHATSEREIVHLIVDNNLVRECIPTQWLNSKAVWDALLQHMPMTAMVRNLGKMTAIELLAPMSAAANRVVEQLTNVENIRKARVHPIALLTALGVYKMGHGVKGSLSWVPDGRIIDALDDAFYMAFENVEPTNKNWFIGLDVSGSMGSTLGGGYFGGGIGPGSTSALTCAEAAGALAMVTIRSERNWFCHGFATSFVDLKLSKNMRLDDVTRTMFRHTMGGTDCALPMLHALKHKIPVDVFAVYTDNETWAGRQAHPHQALRMYREQMGRPAKLIVVAVTSNGFTIADPNDAGMLDVVGFDASAPAVMADFARD